MEVLMMLLSIGMIQLRVVANAIECYSCEGIDNCLNTEICPDGYSCYKTTTDYQKATQFIQSGCARPEQCKTPNEFCIGKANCNSVCCTSNKCNGKLSIKKRGHLKCYDCLSDVSFEKCQHHATLKTCGNTCYKANIQLMSSFGVSKQGYIKGCIESMQECHRLKNSFCRDKPEDECKVHCCEGYACNNSLVATFKAALMYLSLFVVFIVG